MGIRGIEKPMNPLGLGYRLQKGYQLINVRVRVGFPMEALWEKIPKIDDRI